MSDVSTTVTCPVCGKEAAPGDRFCEVDGTPLDGTGHECVDGGDGFCATCGMKMAAPTEVRAPSATLAAATHVGKSHDTDEDAIAVGQVLRGEVAVLALVVCDGVTSSSHGEQAAAAAADAALATMLDAATAETFDAAAAVRDAAAAAHRAACTAPIAAVEGKDPPGATFVAALATAGRVDVSWVGDSRAYLIGADAQAVALTHDHSWANLVVDNGQMTEAEAMRSPYAHAITHCIGPLEDPDADKAPEPSVGHIAAEAGTRLILCSDGLWNYAPSPDEIGALVGAIPDGADAQTVATTLVDNALAMGGHDDISVAVALL